MVPKGPKKATSHGNHLINVPVSFFYLSTRESSAELPGISNLDPYETLTSNEAKLVKGIHLLWGEKSGFRGEDVGITSPQTHSGG